MRISDKLLNILLSVLDLLCLSLVSVFIYKFISPYPYMSVMFRGEALFEPYWSMYTMDIENSPLQVFWSSLHPWYIHSFFQVLTQRYLADILQLHPAVYLEKYQKFFFFGMYLLFLLSLLKNFTKYFEKTRFSYLLLPFASLLVINLFIKDAVIWIMLNSSWFFPYIFITTIFLTLLSRIEYLYVNFQKPSKRELLSIILLIICLSVSCEVFRFVLCFGSLVLFFTHKSVFKCEFKRKYLYYWLALVLVCTLNFFNKSFVDWFLERCVFTKAEVNNAVFSFQYLIQYFSGYFQYLIKRNYFITEILILLLFYVFYFISDKEKNKRLFIYIFSLIFSLFAFFIAIIIGNEYSDFAFEHHGLRMILISCYVYSVLSVMGYSFKNSQDKKQKIFLTLFTLFQFLTVFSIPDFKKELSYDYNDSNEARKMAYMIEKMFVLYGKEHKKYYFMKKIYDIDRISVIYLLDRYDKNSSIKDYEIIEICNVSDNKDKAEDCKNEFLKLFEEKTGEKITKEELENSDFSVFDKYAANNRKNNCTE